MRNNSLSFSHWTLQTYLLSVIILSLLGLFWSLPPLLSLILSPYHALDYTQHIIFLPDDRVTLCPSVHCAHTKAFTAWMIEAVWQEKRPNLPIFSYERERWEVIGRDLIQERNFHYKPCNSRSHSQKFYPLVIKVYTLYRTNCNERSIAFSLSDTCNFRLSTWYPWQPGTVWCIFRHRNSSSAHLIT